MAARYRVHRASSRLGATGQNAPGSGVAADGRSMSAAPSGPPPLVARLVTHGLQVVGVALSSIVVITLVTSLWWRLTPERELDVLVYDQTVPDESYAQHAALGQLLDYHRVAYDLDDYIGVTPGTWEPYGTWPTERPDLIVLADATGVLLDAAGNPDPTGDRRVSGGIAASRASDIARWVAEGTPAYAEFAMVTEPTTADAATTLEELFGFRSSGWRIRFFDDLTNVSPGIQNLGVYPWPYSGPGMIAVSGPDGGREQPRQLVVLTADDLTRDRLVITGGPPGGPGGVTTYDGWASVVQADPDAIVDAAFEIPVTDDGRASWPEPASPPGSPRSFAPSEPCTSPPMGSTTRRPFVSAACGEGPRSRDSSPATSSSSSTGSSSPRSGGCSSRCPRLPIRSPGPDRSLPPVPLWVG